jgi:hypothetical protein
MPDWKRLFELHNAGKLPPEAEQALQRLIRAGRVPPEFLVSPTPATPVLPEVAQPTPTPAENDQALFILGGALVLIVVMVGWVLYTQAEWWTRRREAREGTRAAQREVTREETLKLEADQGTASPLGAIVVRLCRVLYVVCYLLTLLVTAALSWPTPSIDNALVVCRDGTTWDAAGSGIQFAGTDLHRPRKLLCGLCTKRTSDGTSYWHCDDAELVRQEEAYRLKNIQYAWHPSITESITTMISVAVAALIILEVMRMTSAYIFFGKPGKPFWWP